MAEKVMENKKTAAVVPSSVEQQQQARASPPVSLFLPPVRCVILWTLVHAATVTFTFAFSTAYILIITTLFTHPPSWLLPRDMELSVLSVTDVLMLGMLWCATPQAAAGVLALTLPAGHRRHLLLAYAALVATAAAHCCLLAALICMLVGDAGGLFKIFCITVIFVFGVGDILCFLGLVLRGGEE